MYQDNNGAEAHIPSAAGGQPSYAATGDENGGAEGEVEEEDDDGLDIQLDEPEAAPEPGGSEVCLHLPMPCILDLNHSILQRLAAMNRGRSFSF